MSEYSAWAEINLNSISGNINELRNCISKTTELMAVVKANAYGHGAVKVAQTAVNSGVKFLGVSRINEGIELRKSGVSVPILIFGYTHVKHIDKLLSFNLTQTLFSYEMAKLFSDAASRRKKPLKVHLKIDTGMGRLGLYIPGDIDSEFFKSKLDSVVNSISRVFTLPWLDIEGLYTHFASADSLDLTSAKKQLHLFNIFIESLEHKKIKFRLIHAANSAAITRMPESHFDMVRSGIFIYGLHPSNSINLGQLKLTPAMMIKALIIFKKEVPAGFMVGYGSDYITTKKTTIATIPLGYGDGYSRQLSSKGSMLVNGIKVPVVGKVCMDLLMLDIGKVPHAAIGDEVVIIGKQKGNEISVNEVAEITQTVNYEIITNMATRIPRVYTK